jgi:hypothetical protein
MPAPVVEARSVAAHFLEAHGQDAQARIVRAGAGDDFPEVQVALLTLESLTRKLERYGRALGSYAAADFWEAECPEAALAFHDRGEVARAALAGRELFELHLD